MALMAKQNTKLSSVCELWATVKAFLVRMSSAKRTRNPKKIGSDTHN